MERQLEGKHRNLRAAIRGETARGAKRCAAAAAVAAATLQRMTSRRSSKGMGKPVWKSYGGAVVGHRDNDDDGNDDDNENRDEEGEDEERQAEVTPPANREKFSSLRLLSFASTRVPSMDRISRAIVRAAAAAAAADNNTAQLPPRMPESWRKKGNKISIKREPAAKWRGLGAAGPSNESVGRRRRRRRGRREARRWPLN